MAIFDLELSEGSDLILDTLTNPTQITGNAAIVQIIRQHLKLWLGNWFRDESYGTDWIEILKKKINRNGIVQIITASLLQLSFVEDVIDVYIEVDNVTRQSTLTYILIANNEEFIQTEVIQ